MQYVNDDDDKSIFVDGIEIMTVIIGKDETNRVDKHI